MMTSKKKKTKKPEDDLVEAALKELSGPEESGMMESVKTPQELSNVGIPSAVDQIIRPIEVYLIQPMSSDQTDSEGNKVKPGMFYNPATEEAKEELEVVILGFTLERIKFVDDEDSTEVECRSRDSLTGSTYGDCDLCKFSKWKDGNPPPCQQYFRFICLDRDGNPFMLRAKGTSFGPARKYINGIMGQSMPLFSTTTIISSKKVERKARKYYKLEFSRGEERNLDQMKKAAKLSMRITAIKSPFNKKVQNAEVPH